MVWWAVPWAGSSGAESAARGWASHTRCAMGGDRPENRKEAYKKQKRREEGGGGGGGSERRKGGGKPPRVNGMSYEKPQPAFLQKMMASGAQKARAKPDIRAEDVLPTMSERAARGGGEQWPDREGQAPPEESAAAAAERARVDEAQAARAREEAAAAAKLREQQAREEQARYAAGHGVQAAAGQMRVIFTKRRAEPAAEEAHEGPKKKKKKKKAKVKSSLLSFGDGEDDGA